MVTTGGEPPVVTSGHDNGDRMTDLQDAILDRLVVTVDPAARLPLHRELLREQMGEVALMPLYWNADPVLALKGLTGIPKTEGKGAARAEREALAARRLRHDRCVRAYDVGHDTSHVYIAYEYVPGRTLREALQSGALSSRKLVEVNGRVHHGQLADLSFGKNCHGIGQHRASRHRAGIAGHDLANRPIDRFVAALFVEPRQIAIGE